MAVAEAAGHVRLERDLHRHLPLGAEFGGEAGEHAGPADQDHRRRRGPEFGPQPGGERGNGARPVVVGDRDDGGAEFGAVGDADQVGEGAAAEHHGRVDAPRRGILDRAHDGADADTAADQQRRAGTLRELEPAAERPGDEQAGPHGDVGERGGAAAGDTVDDLDGPCLGVPAVDRHRARQQDPFPAAGRHRDHQELTGERGAGDGARRQEEATVPLAHVGVFEHPGVVPDRLRPRFRGGRAHGDEAVEGGLIGRGEGLLAPQRLAGEGSHTGH